MAVSAIDPARYDQPRRHLAGPLAAVLVLGLFALALLGGVLLSLLRLF